MPGVSVEEVKAMLEAGKPVQIIDAGPRHSMSRLQDIMNGAAVWKALGGAIKPHAVGTQESEV